MADETSLDETSIALILVGAFVMIFGIIFTADSFVTNPIFKGYDPFVKLLLGLFFFGSGAILVAVSKKGHEKVEVKTYPGVSVGVGIVGFLFGMMLFLDGWSRYNNPLYPFASQAIKQDILLEILLGLFFAIAGIALTVKGFIDYAKRG